MNIIQEFTHHGRILSRNYKLTKLRDDYDGYMSQINRNVYLATGKMSCKEIFKRFFI